MREIGGYFGLELSLGSEYHKNAIRLNTGRNAFEYILRAKNYNKVYLPYYTCDAMFEPIHKLKIRFEFYSIDNDFYPNFDFKKIGSDEAFVYTNYFGLCNKQTSDISKVAHNLIVDNSQAFYNLPLASVDTFYSPRKFFGVPDGGYLYTENYLTEQLPKDFSGNRFKHLIGRIESSATDYYEDFKSNDIGVGNQPIKSMSNITQRILLSIDYKGISKKRRKNFENLHTELAEINQLAFQLDKDATPMVYPLLIEKSGLREYLNKHKVYVAQYWANVLEWCNKKQLEYLIAEKTVFLPIDQRYTLADMALINNLISQFYYT